jgi:hypothetical protein
VAARSAIDAQTGPYPRAAAMGHVSATGPYDRRCAGDHEDAAAGHNMLLDRVAQAQQPGDEQAPRPPQPSGGSTDTGPVASGGAECSLTLPVREHDFDMSRVAPRSRKPTGVFRCQREGMLGAPNIRTVL